MFKQLIVMSAGAALMIGASGCAKPVEIHRKQGLMLYSQQQYEQAMTTFDAALRDDQFDAVSNAYAGLLHYRRGEFEQAEYHCRVALSREIPELHTQ